MSSAASEFLKTHEIVRAGAGAGKTYTLTHKVMDIAEDHLKREGRLPRLVVTTFTRKATQELRERLMVLALDEKPHLVDFVNSRSNLVVSTIHGVMDLYLKRYGGNICVDPGYKVISGAEAGKIARQTLRQVLLDAPEASDLLESFPFNRLVALFRRLDALLSENPDVSSFSIADFESLFAQRALEVARDLNAVAFKIKEESVKTDWLQMADDYRKLASLLKAGDWVTNRDVYLSTLGAMTSARKNAKSPPVTDATADEAKEVRERAKELSEPLYDPSAWLVFTSRYQLIDRIGREFSDAFRRAKIRQGLLEISDLELLAMDCVRKHPSTAEAFWKEWDHWLIDEYQDTSPFQVELLRKLSGERPNFIVGDPQQSIYLFRGARSEVFGEKEEEILGGGGDRRLLTMNRRSRPELLLFLNDFFARLDPPFKPMEPFVKEGDSIDPKRVVATVFVADPADAELASESEAPVEESEAGSDQEDSKTAPEMMALVAHVQRLMANGAKPEDICVLARTNRVLSEVASWLSQYRLPTHLHAASGFYDRREIRDALAFLKFLVNPHDNFNLIEVLRSPWFKMPDETLAEMLEGRPESLWERLLEARSSADQFQIVGLLQHSVQDTMVKGLSETFKDGLISAGFIDLAHVHDVSGRRESNIWKLLAKLQQEESMPGFNPLAFIAGSMNALKIEEGNAEGDAVAAVEPDRINLMTVHASKGLEFKHVIFPRMEQKPRLTTNEEFTYDEDAGKWALRVPYGEDRDMVKSLPEELWLERFQKQELNEHARVLYVALTRAVETVYLSWTRPAQKNSWAEMVKLDLAPGVHATESYSYEVLAEKPELRAVETQQEEVHEPRAKWRELTEPQGALGLRPDMHRQKAMSVTQLLDRKAGLHFVSGANPGVTHRLKVASEGTAVHRLMELLKYPSQDRLGQLVRKWFPGQEEKILAGIEFVRDSSNPPLMEIIKNGSVEWGFSIKEDGLLIEGQVDLWGRTDSGEAWIVDYKTGNPEFKQKAFEQMSLYALALRKSGQVAPNEKLHLAAVYPFAREVFTLPELSKDKVAELFGFKPR